jgi:preprotein translocase subunit YajC
MNLVTKILVLIVIALTFPLVSQAQTSTLNADLGACIAYMSQGDLINLIGGSIAVVIVVVFAFLKKSIPSFLKSLIDGFVAARGKKK